LLWKWRWAYVRGLAGHSRSLVSMVLTSQAHRAVCRRRTAVSQRSPLGTSTAGSLMSALWTPSRAP